MTLHSSPAWLLPVSCRGGGGAVLLGCGAAMAPHPRPEHCNQQRKLIRTSRAPCHCVPLLQAATAPLPPRQTHSTPFPKTPNVVPPLLQEVVAESIDRVTADEAATMLQALSLFKSCTPAAWSLLVSRIGEEPPDALSREALLQLYQVGAGVTPASAAHALRRTLCGVTPAASAPHQLRRAALVVGEAQCLASLHAPARAVSL